MTHQTPLVNAENENKSHKAKPLANKVLMDFKGIPLQNKMSNYKVKVATAQKRFHQCIV